MEKVVPSSVEFASRRHTRHATDVGAVERHRALGESREIGCVNPVRAVRFEHATVEGVVHDHDGSHGGHSCGEGAYSVLM